jgi:hypothetical protein
LIHQPGAPSCWYSATIPSARFWTLYVPGGTVELEFREAAASSELT